MTTTADTIIPMPVGSFVELDDPLTGSRYIGLVCDSGREFIQYVDDETPPTPLPILAAFSPAPWGDYSLLAETLMLKGDVDAHSAFSDLLIALCDTPAVGDALTLNRAAKWAFESGVYDAAQASAAGIAATANARERQSVIAAKAADWIATGAVQ